mgnify:CR=1 FL=1
MKEELKLIVRKKDITNRKELDFENKSERHLIALHVMLNKQGETNRSLFLKEYQKILLNNNIPV